MLLGFFVHGVCLAERTVLFRFHTFRVVLLLFCQIVISLLTFCTSKCDFNAHEPHLRFLDFDN